LIRSQVEDYCQRGPSLGHLNIISFFVDTYELEISEKDKMPQKEGGPGRKRHARHFYHSLHPKSGQLLRVSRQSGHNTLPNFIGYSFPREDDRETADYFFACMLMLLKPWREYHDLLEKFSSWKEAYMYFISNTGNDEKRIISNIQHFHRSKEAAAKESDGIDGKRMELDLTNCIESQVAEGPCDDAVMVDGTSDQDASMSISKSEDDYYSDAAVFCGELGGVFLSHNFQYRTSANIGVGDDIPKLQSWIDQLKRKNAENDDLLNSAIPNTVHQVHSHAAIYPLGTPQDSIFHDPGSSIPSPSQSRAHNVSSLRTTDMSNLNEEQRRVVEIILWHLDATEAGQDPPQLLMLVHGEGGTGKSKVIQTITAEFEIRGVHHKLAKVAPTGIAASLIQGETIHRAIRIRPNQNHRHTSAANRKELEARWGCKHLLIVDEDSMLDKTRLAIMASKISLGRAGSGLEDQPFGGLNVILFGDFHQFPPVAGSPLYTPINSKSSETAIRGRAIFEQFKMCLLLQRQMRVSDPVWQQFLSRLRLGNILSTDIALLESLIISPEGEVLELEIWKDAKLITPRHSVRKKWNTRALKQHSDLTGNQIFVWRAERTLSGEPIDEHSNNLFEEWRRTGLKNKNQIDLSPILELAQGSQVMVTFNIDTDIDVANGTRAVVENIVLDPDEPPFGTQQYVYLKFMPLYILVRLEQTRACTLQGLVENVIPIVPWEAKHSLPFYENGFEYTKLISERQYPLTLGYAFTDYRSQGQTMKYAIIDIADPPTGKPLSLFHIYVALSRTRGRDYIRLLRPFSHRIFSSHLPDELLDEDERLESMDRQTREWWSNMSRRRCN
jgi:hypothetical protein